MRERVQLTRIEPRWPVAVAILVVAFLLSLLPGRIRVFPVWVPPLLAIALMMPTVTLDLTTDKTRWLRIERIVTPVVLVIAAFGVADQLVRLLAAMVHRPSETTGLQLLTSSIAVWETNVFIFAVVYWRTDRGGPEARSNGASKKPDWLFPQEGVPEDAPLNWRPTFIDYLFLSFCTATAFSPAEAQPLTSRGMLLLMLESVISLVTVIAVAARAINILGG